MMSESRVEHFGMGLADHIPGNNRAIRLATAEAKVEPITYPEHAGSARAMQEYEASLVQGAYA